MPIAPLAAEPQVDQPFFPVSKVRVRTSDTGHKFRRQWAVVADDTREIFSIVPEGYLLVTNMRAYELGRMAFTLVFGPDAATRLQLFRVTMPRTRSWVHIDLTAEGLEFVPWEQDTWLPFLRVTNSYNRRHALGLTVGVYRQICTNGMIVGERLFKLKVPHSTYEHPERRRAEEFAHRRFDSKEYGEKLQKLTRLSVPPDRFLAGILEILGVKPPARPPRNAARRNGWLRLGRHLSRLGDRLGGHPNPAISGRLKTGHFR